MAARPDSRHTQKTSAARDPRRALDLPLNGPIPGTGVREVPDLRLAPEVDPAAARRSDHMLVDRRNGVSADALATLTALRDVCARIDQRLARAEKISLRDGVVVDENLQDVCAQIHDRLGRVEAALQRTEGYVADKPWDVSTIAYKRLERVEETLKLTQQSLADSTLPEMCVNIERQLVQTRQQLQRTDMAAANERLREICETLDARLVRTEDTVRRSEDRVAEWLQELSADMTSRFAEAEETIQRIERFVSTRPSEPPAQQQTPRQLDHRGVQTNAELVPPAVVRITWTNALAKLPRVALLAVAALVVLAVFVGGALIGPNRGPDSEVALASSNQKSTSASSATTGVATPSAQSLAAPSRPLSTTAPKAPAPRTARDSRVSAPAAASTDRASSSTADRPGAFVGSLSVTSVPPGAVVTINGSVAGVTPLNVPRQRVGSHAIQVAQEGFERWSAAVRVPADQRTAVHATLRPITQ